MTGSFGLEERLELGDHGFLDVVKTAVQYVRNV